MTDKEKRMAEVIANAGAAVVRIKRKLAPDAQGFVTAEGLVCSRYNNDEGMYLAAWEPGAHYHVDFDNVLGRHLGKRVRVTYKVEVLDE